MISRIIEHRELHVKEWNLAVHRKAVGALPQDIQDQVLGKNSALRRAFLESYIVAKCSLPTGFYLGFETTVELLEYLLTQIEVSIFSKILNIW
jgi:hypothetical protein